MSTPTATTQTPEPAKARPPTPSEYIYDLGMTFPCLQLFLMPKDRQQFNSVDFMRRFRSASTGELLCAKFLVSVWDPSLAWEKPDWRFDLMDFLGTADLRNRAAFLAWANNPYFV